MNGTGVPGVAAAAASSSSPSSPPPLNAGAKAPAAAAPATTAADTVGSLLAGIAYSLSDGLRVLMFADKRQWGPDEFEQIRALEETLGEAKFDFQAMSRLVNGQFFYERDRTTKSLEELRDLNVKFSVHVQNFKDWLRIGGPINPTWALETVELRRELHRAQCRAACRIFATGPGPTPCLGAFQVRRRQRELQGLRSSPANGGRAQSRGANEDGAESVGMLSPGAVAVDLEQGLERPQQPQPQSPPAQQSNPQSPPGGRGGPSYNGVENGNDVSQPSPFDLEALVPYCNAVGGFERLGDRDVAFVCDYCDGFLVWEDVQKMPSKRRQPGGGGGGLPEWQAEAKSVSSEEEKGVVFAPVAIANHLPPDSGDWRARVLCPYCDEYAYYDQGEEGDEVRYAQDERGLLGVAEFQEHLEWYHGVGVVPMPSMPTKKTNCVVM